MKGKNGMKDPYLADFTQRILDSRRSCKEMLDTEQQEAEEVSTGSIFTNHSTVNLCKNFKIEPIIDLGS